MQKLKEYLAVRAVRLGVLAVLVATFVGLPSLKYYNGTHAFDKLDVVSMATNVFLAQDMQPSDGSYPPPSDGMNYSNTNMNTTCMWRDDAGGCVADGVWAYTTQYDGGQPRWCRALGSGWSCQATDPGGSTGTTPTTTPTNGGTTSSTTPSCMWLDDSNNCVADGVWAYTTKYDGGQPRWCRALGSGWSCQATDPGGSTGTTPTTPGTNGQTTNQNFQYVDAANTQPVAVGAVDDLSVGDVTVNNGSGKVTVNVCSSSDSVNNIGYYIVRAELAGDSRIGATQYVQNQSLSPGACADIEISLSGLKNTRPGQHYNLQVRLRNDDAKLKDMNRGNDEAFVSDICFKDSKFAACESQSNTSTMPAGTMGQMGPMPYGAASDMGQMGPMPYGDMYNSGDNIVMPNEFSQQYQTGPMPYGAASDMGQMGQFGNQPQFGFQFGGQEVKSQYDFASDFGDQFNTEYADFQGGFGEYNFGDDSQFQTMNAGDINRDKRDLAQQLKNQEDMTREFARMAKRIDRFVQEIEREKSRVTKDKERATKQGGDVSEFEGATKTYDTLLSLVKEQISELEVLKNLHASDLAGVKAKIEALGDSSSFQDVEIARADARKLETYWTVRDAMDNRVSTLEQLRMPYDFLAELGRLRGEYSRAGTTMNSEVAGGLAKFEASAKNLLGYQEQAKALYNKIKSEAGSIRSITDTQAINEAVQDLMDSNWDINDLRQEFQDAMMDFNGNGGGFGPMPMGSEFGGQNGPQGGFGPQNGPQGGPQGGHQGGNFGNGPFDLMGRAWEGLHSLKFAGEMKDELTMISQELQEAKKMITILNGLNIQNSKVQRAIQELSSLAEEGVKVMDKMKAFLDSGKAAEQTGQMDQFWQIMEKIGMSADRSMQTLRDYFNSNPSAVTALGSDADFVLDFVNDMEGPGGHNGPQFNDGQFQEFGLQSYDQNDFGKFQQYGEFDDVDQFNNARLQFASAYDGLVGNEGFDMDALVAQIRADVIQEVTRKVTAEVMFEVSKHVGDDIAGKILNNVMNNLGNFGDRGEKLLENTSKVLNVVASIEIEDSREDLIEANPELEDELDDVEALIDMTKGTAIAESTQVELGGILDEVRVLVETGGDEKEFQDKIKEARKVLEDNEDALVFEEGVKFKDTGLGENWFDGYVTGARQDGIVSGYKDAKGNLTGEYGPGNNVTKAEALKMALEAAGKGVASGAPQDGSAQGQWYEGYVKKAEELGFEIIQEGGWNEPADRETVAVLVSQAFDLGGESYEVDNTNFFPDVSANDSHAGYLQAVKDREIFTGDSGSGKFRGEDGINRAEVAKVMNVAMQNAGNISNELSDFNLDIDASNEELFNASEDGFFQDGQESVFQKKTSFWDFLQAMIPLLW